MPSLIVIGGAPGTGKSTLARQLRSALRGPWIDFGQLREFHLEQDWSNQSPAEESMTFENLIAIVRNYVRHGYSHVIVDDLKDHRVCEIPRVFADLDFCILSLLVREADELRRRITLRDDGWRDTEAAVAWNQRVTDRAAVHREHKIDVTAKSPAEVVAEAMTILGL